MYAYIKINEKITINEKINSKKLADILGILLAMMLLCRLAESADLSRQAIDILAKNENCLEEASEETGWISGINTQNSLHPTTRMMPENKLNQEFLLPKVPVINPPQTDSDSKAVVTNLPFSTPESAAIPEKPASISPEQEVIADISDDFCPDAQTAITDKSVIIDTEPAVNTKEPIVTNPETIVNTEESAIIGPEQALITGNPSVSDPEQTLITEKPSVIDPEQTLTPEKPSVIDPEQTLTPDKTADDSDTDKDSDTEDVPNQNFLCGGFICDSSGKIIGCQEVSVIDEVLCLPSDKACTGIAANAFVSIGLQVCEIYIPANIIAIEEGAFNGLTELWYIEVHPDNPIYASTEGYLYEK